MKIVFIDAYNVINSWPNLKNLINDSELETSRKKLIETIENYSSFKNCKSFIVFDAHRVKNSEEKEEFVGKNKSVSIVYTKGGETADSYIERRVDELGKKYDVLVVTSDNLEQQTIFQRGANRMPSLEFYNEVIKVEEAIREKTKRNYAINRNLLMDSLEEDVAKRLDDFRKRDL
ncbi:NYN domain-containing protein [Clostridium mediterraneense]|uniref:NYN domain-containing protein n=1 Tax=Clostridium mediterraneense TaxID=1805472 RepID=UPI00083543E6|nr:NYN domain-containing protein [Clostridium mediterraneense]